MRVELRKENDYFDAVFKYDLKWNSWGRNDDVVFYDYEIKKYAIRVVFCIVDEIDKELSFKRIFISNNIAETKKNKLFKEVLFEFNKLLWVLKDLGYKVDVPNRFFEKIQSNFGLNVKKRQ